MHMSLWFEILLEITFNFNLRQMATIASLLPFDKTLSCLCLLLRGGVTYRLPQCLAGHQLSTHPPCARSLVRMLLLPALRIGRIPIRLGISLPRRRLRHPHPQVSCLALLVYVDADDHRRSTYTWNKFRVSLLHFYNQSFNQDCQIKTTLWHKIIYHISLYNASTSGHDSFQISAIWCVHMCKTRWAPSTSSSWQDSRIDQTYGLF